MARAFRLGPRHTGFNLDEAEEVVLIAAFARVQRSLLDVGWARDFEDNFFHNDKGVIDSHLARINAALRSETPHHRLLLRLRPTAVTPYMAIRGKAKPTARRAIRATVDAGGPTADRLVAAALENVAALPPPLLDGAEQGALFGEKRRLIDGVTADHWEFDGSFRSRHASSPEVGAKVGAMPGRPEQPAPTAMQVAMERAQLRAAAALVATVPPQVSATVPVPPAVAVAAAGRLAERLRLLRNHHAHLSEEQRTLAGLVADLPPLSRNRVAAAVTELAAAEARLGAAINFVRDVVELDAVTLMPAAAPPARHPTACGCPACAAARARRAPRQQEARAG